MGEADCRLGGDRRRSRTLAAQASRSSRRIRGAAARSAARGSRIGACRAARTRTHQPHPSDPLRAAGHRHAGLVASAAPPGASGSRISTISPRACCAGRDVCCACSASSGRWRRSDRSRSKRRAASSPSGCARSTSTRPRIASAVCSSALRSSCAAACSRWCSCRRSPSGCFRRRRGKIRCCSTSRCASPLDAGLFVQDDRLKNERLMLRLAVGAPTERLWLSYPRLDVSGARPRVPSFYMLDVMRAVTGRIPNHEALQRDAAIEGGARLDWPAPADASLAIDEVEHDLSTLRELIGHTDRARGARPRELPAGAERCAAAIGGSPLGACSVPLALTGWPRRPERCDQADARDRSAWAHGRIPCRRSRSSRCARTSSRSRRSTGFSRTRSPSRCNGSIR